MSGSLLKAMMTFRFDALWTVILVLSWLTMNLLDDLDDREKDIERRLLADGVIVAAVELGAQR